VRSGRSCPTSTGRSRRRSRRARARPPASPSSGATLLARRDDKGNPPTLRMQNAWLSEHAGFRAVLVDVGGEKFDIGTSPPIKAPAPTDLTSNVALHRLARRPHRTSSRAPEDPSGKGPARFVRSISGRIDPTTPYKITSIETKRTTSRPGAPFITSCMQVAATAASASAPSARCAPHSSCTKVSTSRAMDQPASSPTCVPTRRTSPPTQSTWHATFVKSRFGDKYLPDKPNFYTSSNKDAQEAHEAIRPTNARVHTHTPQERALNPTNSSCTRSSGSASSPARWSPRSGTPPAC
jgi:DNA topoisomerase-1